MGRFGRGRARFLPVVFQFVVSAALLISIHPSADAAVVTRDLATCLPSFGGTNAACLADGLAALGPGDTLELQPVSILYFS